MAKKKQRQTVPGFCPLCRNAVIRQPLRFCNSCNQAITGDMRAPYKFWLKCGERNRQCCGGFNRDRTHLYFHGKYWNCAYPEDTQDTSVEMGVEFKADGAHTYWIFDTPNHTESNEYGEVIPYPKRDVEDFWNTLDAQLDEAAEEAWKADVLSCANCGGHYFSPDGPCCESEAKTDDELDKESL